jgi:hypothetical protein
MARRAADTIPDLKPVATRRLPAMADWSPEQAELARSPQTLVWEEADKTVVEVPWWLRGRTGTEQTEQTESEPTRREGPWSRGLAPSPGGVALEQLATEPEPEVMVFVPLDDSLLFETEEPTVQRPRCPTHYDMPAFPGHADSTDEVAPLARSIARPPQLTLKQLAWRLAPLALLAVALGSLLGVVARLVQLLPH